MRFNSQAYEELYPRKEKVKTPLPVEIDPEDQMIEEPVKEEVADGDGTDSEPDSE